MEIQCPLTALSTNVNINVDADRGIATMKPRSPTKPRSPVKAKVAMRQKQKSLGKTMAPTAQELTDVAFLERVAKGEEELVRTLIEEGGQDVNVADERGESALHKAVATGNIELVRLLLKHGVLVDHAAMDGTRAVGLAVKHGYGDMVGLLNEAGADLRVVNPRDGSILLHEACWAGHVEMVEQLLATGQFGDLLETIDHTGRTPLHVAAFRSPMAVCTALVGAGASASVMDKRLNTPSNLAGRMGRRNSKEYLVKCEAAVTVALAATKLKRGLRKQ